VVSREARDIGISLGGIFERAEGFVGIWKERVKTWCRSPIQLSSPAKAGDPVFQRREGWIREAAAYWIPRFRGV
jgi:hypothetical protein